MGYMNKVRPAAERCAGWQKNTHPSPEDVVIVGKMYCEEHPADECEPATREWCVSIGLECGSLFDGERWVPQIWGIDQWVRLPMSVTRGHVRKIKQYVCESR